MSVVRNKPSGVYVQTRRLLTNFLGESIYTEEHAYK